jgi:hypothetical protein
LDAQSCHVFTPDAPGAAAASGTEAEPKPKPTRRRTQVHAKFLQGLPLAVFNVSKRLRRRPDALRTAADRAPRRLTCFRSTMNQRYHEF